MKMSQETAKNDNDVSSNLENDNIYIGGKQDKRKYKCTHLNCHATFLRPSKLERHIRLHTGEVKTDIKSFFFYI